MIPFLGCVRSQPQTIALDGRDQLFLAGLNAFFNHGGHGEHGGKTGGMGKTIAIYEKAGPPMSRSGENSRTR
jgi:hypothetical protein